MSEAMDRALSFAAIPIQGRILERHPIKGGGIGLVVAVPTRPLQRKLLRLPATDKKKFELDLVGAKLLDWCDGKNSITEIIGLFSKEYAMDRHASEKAVIAFFRTLVGRCIVVLKIPQHEGES